MRSHVGHLHTMCLLGALAPVLGLLATGCDDKVEKAIGDMSAKSIETEYDVTDDPLLADWVDMAGHTLLGFSTRQEIPYEFKVIETDQVNAFAAPYGHVYLTTGLLDFVDTPDEVWGVLGHEIGHVVHRHSLSAVKRGFLYNIGLALLGGQSEGLAQIAGVGVGLLSLRYSRDNEYESDDMGRILSYRAGMDPRGNVAFFGKLMDKYEKKRPSRIEIMFQTHPASEDRQRRQQAMPELSGQNAEALLVVGRSYARRFENRRARELLGQALALKPADTSVLVSLGDVELARGMYAEARQSYEAAASLRPGPYVQHGIRLASSPEPVTPGRPAALAELRRLSDEAGALAGQADAAVDKASRRVESLGVAEAPATTGARSVIEELLSLSDSGADLPSTLQSAVAYANGSVNRAIEPVYSVEKQREDWMGAAVRLRATAGELAARLESGEGGAMEARDANVIARSLVETRKALSELQSALTALEQAQPAVKAANESAAQTTALISRSMRGGGAGLAQQIQQSAQITEGRALAALAATRKAKAIGDQAALRALVARMNAAALNAPPELQRSMEGLVAYYTLARPQIARRVRAEGSGIGDTALLLAASHSIRQEPARLARSVPAGSSLVDQVNSAGGRTSGSLILLKYLANALEYEAG